MTCFLRLVNLEYKRFNKAGGMFKSLSRTVTCARELISIYIYVILRGTELTPPCLDYPI